MTQAADRHRELERRLAEGTLSEAEEDKILEEMGDLWYYMTDEECDEADLRAALEALKEPGSVPWAEVKAYLNLP